jgi:hypothetical protein
LEQAERLQTEIEEAEEEIEMLKREIQKEEMERLKREVQTRPTEFNEEQQMTAPPPCSGAVCELKLNLGVVLPLISAVKISPEPATARCASLLSLRHRIKMLQTYTCLLKAS